MLLAALSGVLQAQDTVDPAQKRLAMQLITDSYMLRFYTYLGDDYLNFAGSGGINDHREGAQSSMNALLEINRSEDLSKAWKEYNRQLKVFVERWRQQQYPDWYSLQDLGKAHRVLVDYLDRKYGGGDVFEANLELLDMMEYYMHRNTDVSEANRNPRGMEYDMAKEAAAFDKRLQPLLQSKTIDGFSGVRWKFIKPLFENYDLQAAPMSMLRHGGGLSQSLVAG